MFEAGDQIQRGFKGSQARLGREVLADHAVVVIVHRAVVAMLVVLREVRAPLLRGFMSTVVMAAAGVCVAVGMSDRRRLGDRAGVFMSLQCVQSAVTEERNPAVNGEQAQADQTSQTGAH